VADCGCLGGAERSWSRRWWRWFRLTGFLLVLFERSAIFSLERERGAEVEEGEKGGCFLEVEGGEIYLYKGRKERTKRERKESVGFKINLIKFELVFPLRLGFFKI